MIPVIRLRKKWRFILLFALFVLLGGLAFRLPHFEAERMLREVKKVQTLSEAEKCAAKFGLMKASSTQIAEGVHEVSFSSPIDTFLPSRRYIAMVWIINGDGRAYSYELHFGRYTSWNSEFKTILRASGRSE
ncbi:MAG TPA: hypothetical protein VFG14_19550 [Chthoniobacteraceae bacterium]|nr:hypothetical protein [Chthoniobacteraceae bacterium]